MYGNQLWIVEHLRLRRDTEWTACPCCGHAKYWVISPGGEWWNRDGMQVVRCRACGAGYTNPRLADPEAVYLQWRPWGCLDPGWRAQQRESCHVEHRLRQLLRYTEGRRLLEVGCGAGIFLEFAAQAGLQAVGVDLCPFYGDLLRTQMNLDVRTGSILAANLPDQSFDAVVIWDVLQYVGNPRDVLREVARVSADGAVIAIRVPNLFSYPPFVHPIRRLAGGAFRSRTQPLDTITQMVHYTQHALGRMLVEAGVDVIRWATGQEGADGAPASLRTGARQSINRMVRSAWRVLTGRAAAGYLVVYGRRRRRP